MSSESEAVAVDSRRGAGIEESHSQGSSTGTGTEEADVRQTGKQDTYTNYLNLFFADWKQLY